MLKIFQPDFQRYVKKNEFQAKNGFLIKKRIFGAVKLIKNADPNKYG